jgi:alcohol dehydrogenase class IV
MHATMGLKQLVPALLRCKADADTKADVEARLLCQLATLNAIAASFRVYTPNGASHAIGHMLGPFGVGHGDTSGILLPAVCKYNARHGANVGRQEIVAGILWGIPEMRRLAESKGLKEGTADLGDLLDVLVRGLGMPRTLAEVGVGRHRLEQLAEYSLLDVWSATNPVPLTEGAGDGDFGDGRRVVVFHLLARAERARPLEINFHQNKRVLWWISSADGFLSLMARCDRPVRLWAARALFDMQETKVF